MLLFSMHIPCIFGMAARNLKICLFFKSKEQKREGEGRGRVGDESKRGKI